MANGSAPEGMIGEFDVIESDVEMPASPAMELPIPSGPAPQSEPANATPEVLPEPQANPTQVRSGAWLGVEPAQPYRFGTEKESQASATEGLGFNDNFDQMIEDSSSEILRCTSKEPLE